MKPTSKPKGKKNAPAKKQPNTRPLNDRQMRFCELLVAGETNTDAYLKAGYRVSKAVAAVNAHESLRNPKIQEHLAKLREPQTKKALLTRDRKRELLAQIAMDSAASRSDRIRAIEVDAKMAGHFEPDRVEVEAGPKTLQSIKERAAQVSSALARKYEPNTK